MPASSLFLIALGALMLAAFALPMVLAPLRWAGWLRWRLPQETDLAVYFGRCLGAVAGLVALASLAVAQRPELQPAWFDFLLANGIAMILVHSWGAIRRIQPMTETVEILFWALVSALVWTFRPGG